jgi:hypothetical protein
VKLSYFFTVLHTTRLRRNDDAKKNLKVNSRK